MITCAQEWNARDLVGTYEIHNAPPPPPEPDTMSQLDPPPGIRIEAFRVNNAFPHSENLRIRRCHRFKIKGAPCLIDIGVNVDYPSYFGKYEISKDTLILRCEYYIVHYNKHMSKRKVKSPYNAVYRWVIKDENTLEVNEWAQWIKKED